MHELLLFGVLQYLVATQYLDIGSYHVHKYECKIHSLFRIMRSSYKSPQVESKVTFYINLNTNCLSILRSQNFTEPTIYITAENVQIKKLATFPTNFFDGRI